MEDEHPEGISVEDVQALNSSKWADRDAKIMLGILEDWYFDEDTRKQKYAKDYINLLNQVFARIVAIAKALKMPYVNFKQVKSSLLSQQEFKFKEEEFFPFPLYVAANPDRIW